MDSGSAATAPVQLPVFAAVTVGMTGRSVYEVLEEVGGVFEAAGAVFEGSPDAPGALIALLPPSADAATQAARLGLQAKTIAPSLRLGIDATEVHTKQEQDAKWQQVIDSAVRLQKAARTGEAIAGEGVDQLSHGAAATEALKVGDETFLLLTGVRDLAAVPDPMLEPAPEPEPVEVPVDEPSADVEPVASPPAAEAMLPAMKTEPASTQEPEGVPVTMEGSVAPTRSVVVPPAEPSGTPSSTVISQVARWDGPLIGRAAQLDDVRARFQRAVTERAGACVSIVGEPGIGRTRLARELVVSLGGARAYTISCSTLEAGCRWPLGALVEAVTGMGAFVPAAEARARLDEVFAGQPDADRVVPHLAAMVALDGVTHPDEVRWAIRRLLEVALADAPTVLIVDDVDRTGLGLERLLADVASGVRDTSLLILFTTTRETPGVPSIRLAPLQPEEAEQLVHGLLGAADPGIATAVAARVGGNPFHLEQAVALLTETGTLAPGQGSWVPMADLGMVPLPDGPTGMIRHRLQTLSSHVLAVVGIAAVAGERFAPEPLLTVLPEDARAAAPESLSDLVARGYLTHDEAAGTFRFRHQLFRDATIAGVPEWAQAVTHERFARHLERIAGERMWRHAEEIALQLEAGCRLRTDAHDEDRADAIELLRWAAERAVDEGDLDGAARLERRAAGLVDDDPAARAELLYLAAAHGAEAAPERPADREIAEAALAASVAGDDVDWRVRLLRARLRTTAGHEHALEGARAAADDAILAFGEDDIGWALASAWALRGLVHAARAQNGMVADDLQHAADHAAAAGRPRDETAALRGAAEALLDGPVPVDEAEARCLSFLERVSGPLAEHDIRSAVALLRARRAAFAEARPDVTRAISALEELGAGSDLAVALHRAAQIELLAGSPATAEPHMQRALAAAAQSGDDTLRGRLAASFAHILADDDDRLDEALALADVAEAHASDMTAQVGWRTARARVMARRGRGAQAERLLREGLRIAEQTDSTDLRANALLHAADIRRQAGRPAEAEPFERRALRLFERRGAIAQAGAVAALIRENSKPIEREPAQTPENEAVTTPSDSTETGPPEPTPDPTADTAQVDEPIDDGGSRGLAEEMIAMFANTDAPSAIAPPAEPVPAIAPMLEDTTEPQPPIQPVLEGAIGAGSPDGDSSSAASAEEESKRRWFNR